MGGQIAKGAFNVLWTIIALSGFAVGTIVFGAYYFICGLW